MSKLTSIIVVILSAIVVGLPTAVAAQTTPSTQAADASQQTSQASMPPAISAPQTGQADVPAAAPQTSQAGAAPAAVPQTGQGGVPPATVPQTGQGGMPPAAPPQTSQAGVLSAATRQTGQAGEGLDTAQVVVQQAEVTPDGRLTFSGHGFGAGEATSITVEDDQGSIQARLDPVNVNADGQIDTVSVSVPGGLAPGSHTLRIAGLTSGGFGRAAFQLQWQPPSVHLDAYTGKPTHGFGFSGSGFVPGEQVDIYLGAQATSPLATVAADTRGEISGHDLTIPLINAGDYSLAFLGRSSHTPVSVGFNIQGFHPWAVLDNYYIAPGKSVGFAGEDFVPGEIVQVYLNTRLSQPVAQATADGQGRFSVKNAFDLPDLTGDNQLIFVGQQSQTEVSATFAAAAPPRPSTPD